MWNEMNSDLFDLYACHPCAVAMNMQLSGTGIFLHKGLSWPAILWCSPSSFCSSCVFPFVATASSYATLLGWKGPTGAKKLTGPVCCFCFLLRFRPRVPAGYFSFHCCFPLFTPPFHFHSFSFHSSKPQFGIDVRLVPKVVFTLVPCCQCQLYCRETWHTIRGYVQWRHLVVWTKNLISPAYLLHLFDFGAVDGNRLNPKPVDSFFWRFSNLTTSWFRKFAMAGIYND